MNESKTILVVDDIPLMRSMLVKYVRSLGLKVLRNELGIGSVEVLEAQNGRQALNVLKKHKVDLIFLDLMMPEMDGITFLSHQRRTAEIKDIPVIVCSAIGDTSTVEQAREHGVVGYIFKPFTRKSVETRLRDALSAHQI